MSWWSLNPVSAIANLFRIARESEHREVRQTAIGWQPLDADGRPDASFVHDPTPANRTASGNVEHYRVIRKGKP